MKKVLILMLGAFLLAGTLLTRCGNSTGGDNSASSLLLLNGNSKVTVTIPPGL